MEKLYELHQEARYDLLVLDTPPTPQRARLHRRARAADAVHRGPLAAVLPEADRARHARCSARGRACCSPSLQADHRARPAAGPVRVLPELRRHGRRLQRARPARERAARRPADLVPGRLRARSASRSTRPSTSAASSSEARAAVRRRRRQQGPLRAASRASAPSAERARASCSATRTSATGSAANFEDFRALADRDRRNIARLGRRARRQLRDRGPLSGPRRPRPRRPRRDQQVPVRDRRGRAPGDRRRRLIAERPESPGVLPGDSTCSSWGDRRKFSIAGRPGRGASGRR